MSGYSKRINLEILMFLSDLLLQTSQEDKSLLANSMLNENILDAIR